MSTVEPEFCDTAGAAGITHYTKKSLETKRSRGDGPPFYKAGRKVLYRRDELIAWVLSQRRTSTSDTGQQQAVAG